MHSPTTAVQVVTDLSPTSESVPPKPAPQRLVVRVENDPRRHDQLILTAKDGKVLMHVPFGRLSCRLKRWERVAFFQAEIEDDTLHLEGRAPVEKHWVTAEERRREERQGAQQSLLLTAGAGPLHHLSAPAGHCPCGAPQHKGMCRDAFIEMKGQRSALWRAPGMA